MTEEKFLSGEQYWKLRYLVGKHERKKSDYRIAQLEVKLAESRVRALTARTKEVHSEVLDCQAQHQDFRKEIEKDLGISLNSCVIDEYTFKVTKIETTEGEENG